eukprot:CAMPEP_0202854156 /NCGR_PEP_ID=MMETSP1389-20130828/90855_1 /ASSEMBLY_ACC=CAM_ASM_000865 /TAXON_ID=302021 /ORGANISM="Rhodomonas sp., Strain CCMP768" /LENGTH=75 /DNA_ID=CAMNT_0049532735 /DNA_START=842 /DNA_END=1069 /DNA_ORIENTATION=+
MGKIRACTAALANSEVLTRNSNHPKQYQVAGADLAQRWEEGTCSLCTHCNTTASLQRLDRIFQFLDSSAERAQHA